jgi:DNA-directed RNA polymerase subunit RPC12/RpoP
MGKEVRENYCHYCSKKLISKIKDTAEKNYYENLKAWKGIQ